MAAGPPAAAPPAKLRVGDLAAAAGPGGSIDITGNGTTIPFEWVHHDDGDGGLDEGGVKDDDRQLTVSNITVNEGNGSNYAVFSVVTVAGQTLNLTLADGTAVRTGSGDTLDFGSTLQYWDPTANTGAGAWTAYSPGFSVPGTAGANTTLLVRVLLNADSAFENSENFTLTAAYANGGAKSATKASRGAPRMPLPTRSAKRAPSTQPIDGAMAKNGLVKAPRA